MNISLTPELERFVNEQVASGMYHSASEVLRDGLRHLIDKRRVRNDKIAELRRELDIGIEQSERGEVIPFEVESLIAEGRDLIAARKR